MAKVDRVVIRVVDTHGDVHVAAVVDERGKILDTVDAEAPARAALNGEAKVVPKAQGSLVESIRVLRVAFTSARGVHTRVALQIRDLIVTAPD